MQHSIWYHHDVEPLSLQFVCNQGNHGVAQTAKLISFCDKLAIGTVGIPQQSLCMHKMILVPTTHPCLQLVCNQDNHRVKVWF